MYKVKGINRYAGSCMMYDFEKHFLTRFFAKLFFAKKSKECDLVIIEEKFGDNYKELSTSVRKAAN